MDAFRAGGHERAGDHGGKAHPLLRPSRNVLRITTGRCWCSFSAPGSSLGSSNHRPQSLRTNGRHDHPRECKGQQHSAVRHSLSLVKLLRVRQAFLRRQDVCRPLGSTLLLRGDALDSLRLMPDAIVDSEVSSPPYWIQRLPERRADRTGENEWTVSASSLGCLRGDEKGVARRRNLLGEHR